MLGDQVGPIDGRVVEDGSRVSAETIRSLGCLMKHLLDPGEPKIAYLEEIAERGSSEVGRIGSSCRPGVGLRNWSRL